MSGQVKGWCPGAWAPMQAEDGFLLRIRPPEGRLTAAQAQGLAELARTHGLSVFSLTSRANLQWRGVALAQHEPLLAGLAGLGLLDADAARERARNIIVTPFWRAGDGTLELARALAAALADFPVLPGKFGFAIDTGVLPVLGDVSADLRLERDAAGRLLVRADGAAAGEVVTQDDAVAALLRLARWFLGSGGAPGGRGRMRAHVKAGHAPPGADAEPAEAARQALPGRHEAGMLAAFAFGGMPVETLARLAALAPEIRLTPWRMLLLPGLESLPALPGMILDPDDPMLRVHACTGAPGCAQAFAPTRGLAGGLAPFLPAGASLHVSGCGKGCAHRGTADFTLIAGPGGFSLNRQGRDVPGALDPDLLLSHPGQVFGTE